MPRNQTKFYVHEFGFSLCVLYNEVCMFAADVIQVHVYVRSDGQH